MNNVMTQLNPPIYLTTPLGGSICHFIWHSGPDELFFGCFQEETGECWWWRNHQIRLCTNISEGRYKQSEIKENDFMKDSLEVHRKRYGNKKMDTK
jgi:hypothetical protein